jgi:hypothetical protein
MTRQSFDAHPLTHNARHRPLPQPEHPPYLVLLEPPDEVQIAYHASRARVHVPVMTLRFHLHGPPSLVRVTNGAEYHSRGEAFGLARRHA